MTNFIFNKTLIIGLGLMGGSIAKALKKYQITQEIFAIDIDQNNIELAKKDEVLKDYFTLENNLKEFDAIIICAPLNQYQKIFTKLNNKTKNDVIIFDIGSVKNFKLKDLPKNFVGCHPIAGSELFGYKNSDADLFIDKKFIICASNNYAEKIFNIAQKIGAKPEYMEASIHDKIYGLVSHLPQFLSFLASNFSLNETPLKIENNFLERAFRLDQSNPEIWGDIFKMNEKNLEFFYEKFFSNLEDYIFNISKINLSQEIINHNLDNFLDKNLTFDDNFKTILNQNFALIFFRILVVLSYLKIPEIQLYKNYGGSGFKDFTAIMNISTINNSLGNDLIAKNRANILRYFEKISK